MALTKVLKLPNPQGNEAFLKAQTAQVLKEQQARLAEKVGYLQQIAQQPEQAKQHAERLGLASMATLNTLQQRVVAGANQNAFLPAEGADAQELAAAKKNRASVFADTPDVLAALESHFNEDGSLKPNDGDVQDRRAAVVQFLTTQAEAAATVLTQIVEAVNQINVVKHTAKAALLIQEGKDEAIVKGYLQENGVPEAQVETQYAKAVELAAALADNQEAVKQYVNEQLQAIGAGNEAITAFKAKLVEELNARQASVPQQGEGALPFVDALLNQTSTVDLLKGAKVEGDQPLEALQAQAVEVLSQQVQQVRAQLQQTIENVKVYSDVADLVSGMDGDTVTPELATLVQTVIIPLLQTEVALNLGEGQTVQTVLGDTFAAVTAAIAASADNVSKENAKVLLAAAAKITTVEQTVLTAKLEDVQAQITGLTGAQDVDAPQATTAQRFAALQSVKETATELTGVTNTVTA